MHQTVKDFFYKGDIVLYRGRKVSALLIVTESTKDTDEHVWCKVIDGNPMLYPTSTLTIVGHIDQDVIGIVNG